MRVEDMEIILLFVLILLCLINIVIQYSICEKRVRLLELKLARLMKELNRDVR